MLKRLTLALVIAATAFALGLGLSLAAQDIQRSSTTLPFVIFNPAVLFANLGTPANGQVEFCSDCTIANPCAGAGNGALAKRLNGIWVCN